MLDIKIELEKLEKNGDFIKVCVVGIGKMGRSLVDRLLIMKGIKPSLIVNRHIEKAHKALVYLGIDEKDIVEVRTVEELEKAIKENKYAITDDYLVGVKVGLDTHARKNRFGSKNEKEIEEIIKIEFQKYDFLNIQFHLSICLRTFS